LAAKQFQSNKNGPASTNMPKHHAKTSEIWKSSKVESCRVLQAESLGEEKILTPIEKDFLLCDQFIVWSIEGFMVEGEVCVRWKGPWGICFTLKKEKAHYYKIWVHFSGPCLVDQCTHYILTRFYSVRPVNSLKIQWNHLKYTHAFCCNDYLWFILLWFLP
jgi:hypothetical protein